ncbi:MAG: hypothetical protein EXS00_08940, partial [Phycisphaerales bacterium]|nr:hypothetical protein [Phycisphaerales bacterium]
MKSLFSLSAAAVVASSASAAVFTGWSATSTTNVNGDKVWSVYANFDMAGLVFLNCFNHGVGTSIGNMGA